MSTNSQWFLEKKSKQNKLSVNNTWHFSQLVRLKQNWNSPSKTYLEIYHEPTSEKICSGSKTRERLGQDQTNRFVLLLSFERTCWIRKKAIKSDVVEGRRVFPPDYSNFSQTCTTPSSFCPTPIVNKQTPHTRKDEREVRNSSRRRPT